MAVTGRRQQQAEIRPSGTCPVPSLRVGLGIVYKLYVTAKSRQTDLDVWNPSAYQSCNAHGVGITCFGWQ